MSFSFGDDPTGSDIDYVRDKIQDTDETDPLLSDESIQAEIDAVGKFLAAARCARKIAARFSRKVTKSIGSRSIQNSNLAKQYFALASELEAEANAGIGAPTVYCETIEAEVESIFTRGMMSNHESVDEDEEL